MSGQTVFGIDKLYHCLVKSFRTINGMLGLVLVKHALKNGSMTFTLSHLPMGFTSWDNVQLDVLGLQVSAELFATKLASTVGHNLLWRPSP